MTSEKQVSRSVVLESLPFAVDPVRDELLGLLRSNGFSDAAVFSVHLALEEAFMNAVDHGNDLDLSKKVKLDYLVTADRVEITIVDEGAGFDPLLVPDPRCGENLYKASGRGLLLMRSYMDVVEFNERGNGVHMVRHKASKLIANSKQSEEKSKQGQDQ